MWLIARITCIYRIQIKKEKQLFEQNATVVNKVEMKS